MKDMLVPSKHSIQGETTRSRPDVVDVTLHKIDMPRSIMKLCKDVELYADVMHANDAPFLTRMSETHTVGLLLHWKT